MNNETNEIVRLWNVIFSWKIAIGLVVCVILAFIITLPFITKPVYESEAIVFVPLSIPNQQISQQGVGFAGEHEIDSYIQILKSNILTDSLITHFGLKTDPQENINLIYKKLESNIKIEKTRYGSVSIKVKADSPEKASKMANYIIDIGESVKRNLLSSNREEAMLYSKTFFEKKANEVTFLEKTIDSLEKHNQAKTLKEDFRYNKALIAYKMDFQELISRKNQFERAKEDFEASLPKVYVVSRALVIDQKIWPKQSLLCVLVAIIYIFLIVVIEIIKRDIVNKA